MRDIVKTFRAPTNTGPKPFTVEHKAGDTWIPVRHVRFLGVALAVAWLDSVSTPVETRVVRVEGD